MKKQDGFSLVEILVVVTIIAILSVIAIVSFSSINSKTKDVKKRSDIDALANAYELKYNAKNRAYQTLTETDFSGPIPNSPAYSELITTPVPAFRICANLASDTESCSTPSSTCYCKQSIHEGGRVASTGGGGSGGGTLILTPAQCASQGLFGQVYSDSSIVGCDHSTSFYAAPNYCATNSHLCTLAEYLGKGGSTTGSNQWRWLSTTSSHPDQTCSGCGQTECLVFSPGDQDGLVAGDSHLYAYKFYYGSSSCNFTNEGWYGHTSKGSPMDGVMCCSGAAPATPAPSGSFKYVFVTSAIYNGDLKTTGSGINGIDGADKICKSAADAAGSVAVVKNKIWQAWLSSNTQSPSTRNFWQGEYRLVDNISVVANSWTDLTDGFLSHSINMTEAGITIGSATEYAWTGTTTSGDKSAFSNVCSNWESTANNFQGDVGKILAGNSYWTYYGTSGCVLRYHLYCFEQ